MYFSCPFIHQPSINGWIRERNQWRRMKNEAGAFQSRPPVAFLSSAVRLFWKTVAGQQAVFGYRIIFTRSTTGGLGWLTPSLLVAVFLSHIIRKIFWQLFCCVKVVGYPVPFISLYHQFFHILCQSRKKLLNSCHYICWHRTSKWFISF